MLLKLKDDPEFKEFLEIHQNKALKATWSNDEVKNLVKAQNKTDGTASDDEELDQELASGIFIIIILNYLINI